MAAQGHFDPGLYDWTDYTMVNEAHEEYDDIVEEKIFKFKYRQNADDPATFGRREARMRGRFLERAKERDPLLEQDLAGLFREDAR